MNGKTRILVVEDNPEDQILIQKEFDKRGDVEGFFVFTGEEAVARIKHDKFHMVLLDLDLGIMKKDGLWVLKEIVRHNIDVPIAILSGVDRTPLVEATEEYPVLVNIQKPLDQSKINQILKTYWL